MFSRMCCIKNTIVFITVLKIVLNVCLLARCGRVRRVVGGLEVGCGGRCFVYYSEGLTLYLPTIYILCTDKTILKKDDFPEDYKGTQPSVASIRNSTSLLHQCGAAVLTLKFAITAAHCVPKDKDQYTLQLNNYCAEEDEPVPRAEILEIIIHHQYDRITRAHDVALLRIALHLRDVSWLNSSRLPTSSFGISGKCTIYGYGYKDVNTMETSETLLAGTLRIVSLDECMAALGPYVAPRYDSGMICAVGDGVDACQGDSGSPLICSGNVIQGLSSYGMSCAVPGLPGVYVSIGAHMPWIRRLIESE